MARNSCLFSRLPSPNVKFGNPGAIGQADIVVQDSLKYQHMAGFGAALTDSSALRLSQLKANNPSGYHTLLTMLFDPTDANNNAGLTAIRIPIGASDFSASLYSWDDTSGDTSFSHFSISSTPSDVWSTLADILAINPALKIFVLPWSAPAWMKDSGSMKGGSLQSQYVGIYAQYLLKAVQAFHSEGITPYAVSIQNEPQNNNPTYPTMLVDPATEAQIGGQLRSLLNSNGYSSVNILALEHNWDLAASYAVTVLDDAVTAFAGASFHCYSGDVSDQLSFQSAFPAKDVYFTECSGSFDSDWWQNIKWNMDNILIGSVQYWSKSAMLWNLALDGNGLPTLPGTDSCSPPGCRGVATINSNSTWMLNEEFYVLAQTSRASLPKDTGGPWGRRIGVSVGGSLDWALVVSAYETARSSASSPNRYTIVVLNWNDGGSNGWNPQPVTATIEFRGQQATYTFPVGVTTLSWYAAPQC